MGETGESYKPSFIDRIGKFLKNKTNPSTSEISTSQPEIKIGDNNPPSEKSLEQMLEELRQSTERQKSEQESITQTLKKDKQVQSDQTEKFQDTINDHLDRTLKE